MKLLQRGSQLTFSILIIHQPNKSQILKHDDLSNGKQIDRQVTDGGIILVVLVIVAEQ